jgi:hypothetical protein
LWLELLLLAWVASLLLLTSKRCLQIVHRRRHLSLIVAKAILLRLLERLLLTITPILVKLLRLLPLESVLLRLLERFLLSIASILVELRRLLPLESTLLRLSLEVAGLLLIGLRRRVILLQQLCLIEPIVWLLLLIRCGLPSTQRDKQNRALIQMDHKFFGISNNQYNNGSDDSR